MNANNTAPKPTIPASVGQKVYFQPAKDQTTPRDGLIVQHGNQPLDATINYVHSDTMVNITVVDHAGTQHFLTSMPLASERGAADSPHAYWMPYQIGRATKDAVLGRTDSAPVSGPADATMTLLRDGGAAGTGGDYDKPSDGGGVPAETGDSTGS